VTICEDYKKSVREEKKRAENKMTYERMEIEQFNQNQRLSSQQKRTHLSVANDEKMKNFPYRICMKK